ncbi:MAG: glycoside hydrolase family 32 protein [Lapillicoccus sp.]
MNGSALDPARAGYHIQPARGWINDPNGMVFRDGRWHVFFQHNPASAVHTDIHWGHVSSDDLVGWREHPVAFGPTPEGPDQSGCWSGVCVDLGDRVAAVYTGILTSAVDSTVCLRYASDPDLDTWSDPVVVATVPRLGPGEIGVREMRDPFVFTWDGRRWALLGAGLTDGAPALLLWACDDLEVWRFERLWLTGADPVLGRLAPAEIWECPQLVEVDGSWALLVSLWRENQLEHTVAAVGSMSSAPDGSPQLTMRGGGRVDDGRSLYAPQVGLDLDGPWFLGWVMQVGAPDEAPEDAVAGCLTLVRRLHITDDQVVSRVDHRQAASLGERVAVGADRTLPAYAQLAAGEDAVTLLGTELTVTLQPGAQAWLDGEILETYAPDAPARTYRDPGTSAWRLAEGATDAVVRHVRARPTDNPLASAGRVSGG